MRDFFAFRTLITRFVIQVLFVIGLIVIVIGSIGAIANYDQPLAGLAILIFGGLYWRIVCELLIVLFRMNKSLDAIKGDAAALASMVSGHGGTPHLGSARVEESVAGPSQPVSTGISDEPGAAASAASAAATATLPPEGWYDDSERPGHTRWWDGTAWGIRDDEHSSIASESQPADAEIAALPADAPPETGQVTATAVEPSSGPAPVGSSEPEPTSASRPERFCENCGAERSPEARFCTSCGHA